MSASSSSATRKRKISSSPHKNLPSLLRYFEGYELAVEVKNGRIYRGIVETADEYMNVMLSGINNKNNRRSTPLNSTQQVVMAGKQSNNPLRSGSFSSRSSSQPQSHHPSDESTNDDHNISTEEQRQQQQQQQQQQQLQQTLNLDWIHIRGANIRYIHFPSDLDLLGTIKTGLDRERSAANKYRRGIRK